MAEDVFEKQRQFERENGKRSVSPEDVETLKRAVSNTKVPIGSLSQRTYLPMVSVPELKPITNDRKGRREADEARRQLGKIALNATRTAVAVEAVRSVNTFVAHTLNRTKDEMMDILNSPTRYEEMNEFMAGATGRLLQLTEAQLMGLAEHHGKRQMENV
jgi:hypothetical protein